MRIDIHALTYSNLRFQFQNAPFKLHKFWFCVDNMNRCVGSTQVEPCHWQTNRAHCLTCESKTQPHTRWDNISWKKWFAFNKWSYVFLWCLFGAKKFVPINYPLNDMAWPTTWNGKIVKQILPFDMFKPLYN